MHVPKLWNETVDAHRAAVRDAILDTAAKLVAEGGPTSVTMSDIAEGAGIGRATLYKYFPDVEAVLVAWHERQVAGHLDQLSRMAGEDGTAGERLANVLHAYAVMRRRARGHHGSELVALVHRDRHVNDAQRRLHHFIRDLIADGVHEGGLRQDVTPDELAHYSLHALAAAGQLPSEAAVRRLVTVTLAGLQAT